MLLCERGLSALCATIPSPHVPTLCWQRHLLVNAATSFDRHTNKQHLQSCFHQIPRRRRPDGPRNTCRLNSPRHCPWNILNCVSADHTWQCLENFLIFASLAAVPQFCADPDSFGSKRSFLASFRPRVHHHTHGQHSSLMCRAFEWDDGVIQLVCALSLDNHA